MTQKAEGAALLLSRKFDREQIAAVFRIPPSQLNPAPNIARTDQKEDDA